jgi:methyl coenzyme M reductase subunit D
MDTSTDRDNRIIQIKSEIFDLQIKYGQIRQEIEIKLKELNELNKNESIGP